MAVLWGAHLVAHLDVHLVAQMVSELVDQLEKLQDDYLAYYLELH